MAVKVFFHICAIQHCIAVIEEQLYAIMYSGLYDMVEQVYCFVTAKDEFSLRYTETLLSLYGKKIRVVDTSINDNTYERFTLTKIHHFIQPEDQVLYIHSKGVTQTEQAKISNTTYWTRAMNYHLIGQHKKCLALLDTYDAVGTYYSDTPQPHFQGNFWWATGKYLLTLPTTIGPRYLDPEMSYLFLNNPKYIALSTVPSSIPDLYKSPLLPTYYLDDEPSIPSTPITAPLASPTSPSTTCLEIIPESE